MDKRRGGFHFVTCGCGAFFLNGRSAFSPRFAQIKNIGYICTCKRIEPWCNGNTADFGSVILGSSPDGSTLARLLIIGGLFVPLSTNVQLKIPIMDIIDFQKAAPLLRDEAWRLYEESFPAYERRGKEAQEMAFQAPEAISKILVKDDTTAAILFYWLQGRTVYLEFLAVNPMLRGQNIGTEAVERLLALHPDCNTILEIEPPADYTTIRRLHFYERMGFVANDYPYIHPSYMTGERAFPHPLTLMSYGRKLTQEEYESFCRFMKETVLRYAD